MSTLKTLKGKAHRSPVSWIPVSSFAMSLHFSPTDVPISKPLSFNYAVYNAMNIHRESFHATSVSWSLCTYLLWRLTRGKHIEVQWAEFQSNLLQCHCTSVGAMFPSPSLCLCTLQSTMLAGCSILRISTLEFLFPFDLDLPCTDWIAFHFRQNNLPIFAIFAPQCYGKTASICRPANFDTPGLQVQCAVHCT